MGILQRDNRLPKLCFNREKNLPNSWTEAEFSLPGRVLVFSLHSSEVHGDGPGRQWAGCLSELRGPRG